MRRTASNGALDLFADPFSLDPQARVTVARDGDAYVATMDVPARPDSQPPPTLVWGTFRADAAAWRAVAPLPPGAVADPTSGGARSLFGAASAGRHTVQVRLPAKSAPVTLAFRVDRGEGSADVAPLFSVPVGMGAGSPATLGSTLARPPPGSVGTSINFAVASRGAAAVALVLARVPSGDAAATALEIDLPPASHRTGDVWHVRVDGLTDIATLAWGWRATGPLGSTGGATFAPGRVWADPYATAVTRPVTLPPGMCVAPRPDGGGAATDAPAVLASLAPLDGSADAGVPASPLAPALALEDLLVLDLDVRSFSTGPSVPEPLRGTFGGVLAAFDAAAADSALARVTAVHLGGTLAAAAPGPAGPAPTALLALDPALAAGDDALAPVRELRALVAGLHDRGVAVLAGVEFCYAGGAGGGAARDGAPLAGLDAALYFRPAVGGSGARVLNAGAPAVRALALASLRHWARSFGVDGFVLAHAEALTQDEGGAVLDAPPLANAIAADAVLARRLVVASSADSTLLPRGGARSFPHWGVLADRNHRLARLLAAWLGGGAHGSARAVADRAAGSVDLTAPAWGGDLPGSLAAARRPAAIANCVLPPGVPTLAAAATGALGGAGFADPAQASSLAKAMLVAACLFRGAPWLPASALETPIGGAFVGGLLDVRAAVAPALAPGAGVEPPPLTWHGAFAGTEPDWDGARAGEWGADVVAFDAAGGGAAVYAAFNPHPGPVPLTLPPPPRGATWARAVDTTLAAPQDVTPVGGVRLATRDYELGAKAALVAVAVAEEA